MSTRFIGIDLAKNVFQVHAVDETGQPVMRKAVSRAKLLGFARQLERCVIGMEACASAHFWARRLAELGHEVRLLPPAYVKPYVKTNKHDAADAEAICEAVQRPTMRFVPVKTPDQQGVLLLHRARFGFVKARTACANQIRATLAEFGLVLPVGIRHVALQTQALIEDATNELPAMCRLLVAGLLEHLLQLARRIEDIEQQLTLWHRQNDVSQRIAQVPGVGLLGATAMAASIGTAAQFHNGRQLAAWLGLVPRQHSSGGKPRLLGISKRGDVYLRTLLIHGARAVMARMKSKPETGESWSMRLARRGSLNVAITALANKMARTIWALVRHERDYRADYQPTRPVAT